PLRPYLLTAGPAPSFERTWRGGSFAAGPGNAQTLPESSAGDRTVRTSRSTAGRAFVAQRAGGTARVGTAADLLAVAAEEQVGLDERCGVGGELCGGGILHGAIGSGIAALLRPVTETEENPQAVRVQRENRLVEGEEEDLLGAGL